MIQYLRAAAPSLYGAAGAAICAFLGTRFSTDQDITASLWAAVALAITFYATSLIYELRGQKRLHGRALRTTIVVIGRDGKCLSSTLLQLLEDDQMYDGEKLSFEDPYIVQLRAWGEESGQSR